MSKLPLVGKEDLDADQKALWDYILNGPQRVYLDRLERVNQMSARSLQSLDADTVIWKVGSGDGGTVAFSFRASW